MRILKIRLRNIHSLKGDHLIDFTIPPLSDSGLFAITGPTGAGKSTILDVITLALFNKIPRFTPRGTEKITKNEIEKSGSVMTHFTDDAFAEVEYISQNQTYRSTWKISKARTGNLKDYEMFLATLPDGNFLDLKNSEVPVENEKIIGLNYDQFIRSILLSQGEFSKFLKSDEKERAKLLEDITGSQIYRQIGQLVYKKHKERNEEILALKQQVSTIKSFGVAELEEKLAQLLGFKNRISEINRLLKEKNHTLTLMQKKISLDEKLKLLNESIKELEKRKTEFGPLEIKWQKHQKLNPFRNDLTLLKSEEDRVLEAAKELNQLNSRSDIQRSNIDAHILKINDFANQEVTRENFISMLQNFQNEILRLEEQVHLLTENGRLKRSSLNKILDNSKNTIAIELKSSRNINVDLEWTAKRRNQLLSRTITYDLPLEDLKSKLLEIQESLLILTKKEADIATRSKLIKDQKELLEQIDLNEKKISISNTSISHLESESKTLHSTIKELNTKKDAHLKIISLEEQRAQLMEGEECPLCGSTEHPYNQHRNFAALGQATFELSEKQIDLDRLTSKLSTEKEYLASTKARLEKDNEQLSIKLSNIEHISKSWDDRNLLLNEEIIKNEVKQFKISQSQISLEINDREEIIFIEEVIEMLNELNNISLNYHKIAQLKQEKYSGKDIKNDVQALQSLMQNLINEQNKIDNSQNIISASISNVKSSISERRESLLPQITVLGYTEIMDVYHDLLDDESVQSISNERDEINRKTNETNANHDSLKKDLQELSIADFEPSLIDDFAKEIKTLQSENDEINHKTGAFENELLRDSENKIQIFKIATSIDTKENENREWYMLDQLIGDATGNKYSKYAQNLSLKILIEYANKRLVQLSDRYLLESSNIEDDLKIMDLYQGNITRSVKTLSGGESFIISLALALSLADMASKNVRLESLFIDEGFGTLDAETLEMALATLEKLQSESNRIIGIISHVDSLKDRITTQIKVNKSNLGHSTIELLH